MFRDGDSQAKYKRESAYRHQSERLLDNNIYKFHKQLVKDKEEKMKLMDQKMREKLLLEAREKERRQEEAMKRKKGEYFCIRAW